MQYTWKDVRAVIKHLKCCGYRVEFRYDAAIRYDCKLVTISRLERDARSTVFTLLHEAGHLIEATATGEAIADVYLEEQLAWLHGALLHKQLFGTSAPMTYTRYSRIWLKYYEV